jgi:hypothetical protein
MKHQDTLALRDLDSAKSRSDTVCMPKRSFVKEHKHLIKLLEKPNKKDLAKEARAQQAELKAMMGKRNA